MTTMLITEGGITSHNSSSQRTPSAGVAPCLQQPVTLGQRGRKGRGHRYCRGCYMLNLRPR
jgi:hypothetical protein